MEATVQLLEEIPRRNLFFSLEIPKQFLFTSTIDNWREKVTASRRKKDVAQKITPAVHSMFILGITCI